MWKLVQYVIMVIPILVSWAVLYHADTVVHFLPVPLDYHFFQWKYGHIRNKNKPEYWASPLNMEWMEHEDWTERPDVINYEGIPKLVRNFAPINDEEWILNRINSTMANQKTTASLVGDHDDHISGPCSWARANQEEPDNRRETYETTWSEFQEEMMTPDHENPYIMFDSSFTDYELITDLTGFDPAILSHTKILSMQAFISNFSRTLIGSPWHCGPADTVSVQVSGKKTWLLFDPKYMARLPNVFFRAFIPIGMTDDDFLDALSDVPIWVAEVGPGDALYIGSNWCHAVISHPGISTMYSLRYANFKKVIRLLPWSMKFKWISRVLRAKFLKLMFWFIPRYQPDHMVQGNNENYGPLFGGERMGYCGTSNRIDETVKFFSDRFEGGNWGDGFARN